MSDKPLGSLKTRGKNGCVGTRVTASEAVMQHDIHYNDVVVIQDSRMQGYSFANDIKKKSSGICLRDVPSERTVSML